MTHRAADRRRFESRRSVALILSWAVARSVMGMNVRSMSTDNRGMFLTKKLIAVPPLAAKSVSSWSNGRVLRSSSACLKKTESLSTLLLRLSRNGYLVFLIKDAAFGDDTFAAPEGYPREVQSLYPGVSMLLRAVQKESFHFY